MKVEIDQSGRVEDLTTGTVVAYSNSTTKSVWISAGEKREVVRFIKSNANFSLKYAPLFFTILILILLENEKITKILIDEEYTGQNNYILNIIKGFFESAGNKSPEIIFGRIGKRSRAHDVAITAYRKKGRLSKRLKFKDIVKFFPKK